jgi:anti-anti-sigma factor
VGDSHPDHAADGDVNMTEHEVLQALVNVRGRELVRRSLGGPLSATPLVEATVRSVSDGRCAVLELSGELDVTGAADLRERLGRMIPDGPVIVDLRQVSFIDSMGLGALIAAHQRSGRAERLAVVVDPGQDAVRRLFEITNLDRIFAICDSLDAAVDATIGADC